MGKRYLFDIDVLVGRLRPPIGMKPYVSLRSDWDDWDDWERVDRQIEFLQSLLNIGLKGLEPGASRPLTYGDLRIRLPHFVGWGELASLAESLHIWPDPKDAKASGPALVARLKGIKTYNHRVRQIAQLARAAVQALSARTPEGAEYPDDTPCPLITVVNGTDEGVGLLLSWRKPVGRLRSNVPTLVLDATCNVELMRQWKPDIELITDARASLPNGCVDVVQVFDSLCPYSGWVPNTERPELAKQSAKEQRRWNNVERLAHFLDVKCADAGDKDVGFIGPIKLERALETYWRRRGAGRPRNILTGHFGAIAGLDFMKDVRFLVVWSRMCPSVTVVEDLARAAYCAPITPLTSGFLRGGKSYILADGHRVQAESSECHPDPRAEAMRAQIVEAELYQAVGRARPFRRTPDNPLTVFIGTSQPTSLPVNRLVTVNELLSAGPIEALAARGVWVPTGAANKGSAKLLAAATGLTVNAVKSHVKRLNVSNPYNSTPIGVCHFENGQSGSEAVEFGVKLKTTDRYFTTVFLRTDLAKDPHAALKAEGIDAAVLEPVVVALTPSTRLPAAPHAERSFVLELFRRHAEALANGITFDTANDIVALSTDIAGVKEVNDAPSYLCVLIGEHAVQFGGRAA